MKPSEVAELLTFAAAFDRRTVGKADALAWHTVLGDLDLEQARQAVADHYANSRDWIMPSDIRQRVRRARAELVKDFQYQPGSPDETAAEYLARRQQQLEAVADGRRPPVLPALPPGRPIGELAAVGRAIPAEPQPVRQPGPFGVACPICHAAVGRPCKTSVLGRRMADAHPSRLDASRRH